MNSLHVIGIFGLAIIVGIGGGFVLSQMEPTGGSATPQAAASAAPAVRYTLCGMTRRNCVVDGDTLWIGEEKIRVADVDTPEISSPQCDQEMALGQKAKLRLLELVNAGPFEAHPIGDRDEDQYGRKLRVLVRDGQSLGDQLVSEGLARTWGGRREPWC